VLAGGGGIAASAVAALAVRGARGRR
jgi:hypothetical protein